MLKYSVHTKLVNERTGMFGHTYAVDHSKTVNLLAIDSVACILDVLSVASGTEGGGSIANVSK
jgi:hypothetical protein